MQINVTDEIVHKFLALEKAAAAAKLRKDAFEAASNKAVEAYNQAKANVNQKMASYESLGPLHAEVLKTADAFTEAANVENSAKMLAMNAERPMKDALFAAMRRAASGV